MVLQNPDGTTALVLLTSDAARRTQAQQAALRQHYGSCVDLSTYEVQPGLHVMLLMCDFLVLRLRRAFERSLKFLNEKNLLHFLVRTEFMLEVLQACGLRKLNVLCDLDGFCGGDAADLQDRGERTKALESHLALETHHAAMMHGIPVSCSCVYGTWCTLHSLLKLTLVVVGLNKDWYACSGTLHRGRSAGQSSNRQGRCTGAAGLSIER